MFLFIKHSLTPRLYLMLSVIITFVQAVGLLELFCSSRLSLFWVSPPPHINCTEMMGFILLQRGREYLLEPGRWRELESTLSFCRARLTQALRFCLSPGLHAQSLTVPLLERKAFCLLLYLALETSAHSLETLDC